MSNVFSKVGKRLGEISVNKIQEQYAKLYENCYGELTDSSAQAAYFEEFLADAFADIQREGIDIDISEFVDEVRKAVYEETGYTAAGITPESMGYTEDVYGDKRGVLNISKGETIYEIVSDNNLLEIDEYKNNCFKLVKMPCVKELAGNEMDGDLPLKQKITELFSKWGNFVYTEQFGNVKVSHASIRSEIRHGSTKEKITSYAAIPSVLQNGELIGVYTKNRGELERIVVAAPIKIAGNNYFMGVMLQRDSNVNRLYLHDVVIKKEVSQYQAEHLNTTGPVDTEDLFVTEMLERAISVGYSISQTNPKVNSENTTDNNSMQKVEKNSPKTPFSVAGPSKTAEEIYLERLAEEKEESARRLGIEMRKADFLVAEKEFATIMHERRRLAATQRRYKIQKSFCEKHQ